jgi:hypothetical protein
MRLFTAVGIGGVGVDGHPGRGPAASGEGGVNQRAAVAVFPRRHPEPVGGDAQTDMHEHLINQVEIGWRGFGLAIGVDGKERASLRSVRRLRGDVFMRISSRDIPESVSYALARPRATTPTAVIHRSSKEVESCPIGISEVACACEGR